MVDIPRADGFLYCITLKFGVYIICLIDVFFSIFGCVGLFLIMVDPKMLVQESSKSDILWTSPESMPSVRAHFLLSAVTVVMGCVGMMGVRFHFAPLHHLDITFTTGAKQSIAVQERQHRSAPGMAELADYTYNTAPVYGLPPQQVRL